MRPGGERELSCAAPLAQLLPRGQSGMWHSLYYFLNKLIIYIYIYIVFLNTKTNSNPALSVCTIYT